ncbi:hypothetical protein CR513_40876, partial [Mucuna pruriens]
MIAFFDACHINMCDIVKNGWYIPTKEDGTKIPRSSWDEDKKKVEIQVTACRASKDLKKLLMEELLGTLKVHEIELNENEGQRKGKSIALKD